MFTLQNTFLTDFDYVILMINVSGKPLVCFKSEILAFVLFLLLRQHFCPSNLYGNGQ